MAPIRRTSTQRNQQSTLSFGRVTKPDSSQRNTKATKKDAALLDVVSNRIKEPTTADLAIQEQASAAKADETSTQSVLAEKHAEPTKTVIGSQEDEEAQARRVKDSQIKKYWNNKEAERKAPRVHQQGLSVTEKILREFDMSGQFGPCIGIARLKRWKRAKMLGLNPPIEVLAVLLKESDKNNDRVQRAYVDELLSSRFVET